MSEFKDKVSFFIQEYDPHEPFGAVWRKYKGPFGSLNSAQREKRFLEELYKNHALKYRIVQETIVRTVIESGTDDEQT